MDFGGRDEGVEGGGGGGRVVLDERLCRRRKTQGALRDFIKNGCVTD